MTQAFSFRPAQHRGSADRASVVPMINVAFLLLIFFLISAQIAPPPPVDLTLPSGAEAAEIPPDARALYLDKTGQILSASGSGPAALAGLAGDLTLPVSIYADAAAPGSDLSALLSDLAQLGIETVSLVVVQP